MKALTHNSPSATGRERPAMVHPTDAMSTKPTLRQVFEAEEAALLRFAFGLTGRREVAEDLVQDAFLKLHHHWLDVDNPRAWLFRAVRNLALNHLRDHRRESSLDSEENSPARESAAATTPGPAETLGRLEALGTLRLLVAELPAADRRLIELKYQEHMKYEQISRQTGLSAGNVGYKLHHLLKHLADSLRQLGVESAGG